jgi:hypothetical protein
MSSKSVYNRRQDMLEVIMEGLMRKMDKLSTKMILIDMMLLVLKK